MRRVLRGRFCNVVVNFEEMVSLPSQLPAGHWIGAKYLAPAVLRFVRKDSCSLV
jgi:hypothetical protein